MKEVLEKRNLVYEMTKQQRPGRWSGDTLKWDLAEFVTLNPNKKLEVTTSEMVEKLMAA